MVKHHIACLKVTIEETVIGFTCQILGEKPKVCLKLQLVEVEFCSFEETVFEIVKIEEHRVNIKLCLRITIGKIKSSCSTDLHIRQFSNGSFQQFLFLKGISASSLTASLNCIEKRCGAQVCLNIAQQIIRNS